MKHPIKYLLAAATIATASLLHATTPVFEECFADSTLRLDYIFGADSASTIILLDKQVKTSGWAGRRHRLSELPYKRSNGILTVSNAMNGDTIYQTSFSSLFHEWLATGEQFTRPRSFPNSFLVPLPKDSATITIKLYDAKSRTLASMTHTYTPHDVLVERPQSKAPEYRYLHRGGTSAEAIDVAILPEGYTIEERDSFYAHATTAATEILKYEPYKSHSDKFNFVAVWIPSADSGVSIPRLGEWKNTAFSSHFSTFYAPRYLTTEKLNDVHDALGAIPYEQIIILANTDEYGGGGIYNSYMLTTARNKEFKPVCVHEFGHSFGGLADEYFYDGDIMEDSYPTDIEPWEPNITTLVDFNSKWASQLAPSTPVPTPARDADLYPTGVYEGGGYSSRGVYRPANECRMRNNSYPSHCPVCIRALEKFIEFYTMGQIISQDRQE